MEFIWSCMVISFKSMLGMLFWSIFFALFGLLMAIIGHTLSGDWKKKKPKSKYEGQPIVVKGGKEDE